MSTRANIIIQDSYEKLYFYRHSDGYPEGTIETLKEFVQLIKDGKIRDNASQSAGWLILIGAKEYNKSLDNVGVDSFDGWKVGAYEPASGISSDIEYLYVIDLDQRELRAYEVEYIHDGYPEANEEETLQKELLYIYKF